MLSNVIFLKYFIIFRKKIIIRKNTENIYKIYKIFNLRLKKINLKIIMINKKMKSRYQVFS